MQQRRCLLFLFVIPEGDLLRRQLSRARVALLAAALVCGHSAAQSPAPQPTSAAQASPDQASPNSARATQNPPASANPALPNSPSPATPRQKLQLNAEEREAARIAALGKINGVPYDQPSHKDQFLDYLRDSYELPALARTTVRSLYEEALDKPKGWGQDFPGFAQRMGSNAAITAIDGNVRFAMETVFKEDMRYIPCHGCSVRRKIQNALLSEVTARHDVNGHRFFTLTPAIADFSGPIIANYAWYPNHDPFGGVVATRTVAATRVGQHLFTEFVLERRHHDPKLEDHQNDPRVPVKPPAVPVATPPVSP